MNPFEVRPCKKGLAELLGRGPCELGDGHRGLCGPRYVATHEDVKQMLAQWREGKYPDKPFGEPEFAS